MLLLLWLVLIAETTILAARSISAVHYFRLFIKSLNLESNN